MLLFLEPAFIEENLLLTDSSKLLSVTSYVQSAALGRMPCPTTCPGPREALGSPDLGRVAASRPPPGGPDTDVAGSLARVIFHLLLHVCLSLCTTATGWQMNSSCQLGVFSTDSGNSVVFPFVGRGATSAL